MKRKELNYVLEQDHCKKGGTHEACVKVREFLHFSVVEAKNLQSLHSCVSGKEFVEAVKVLMAHAAQTMDTVPKKWYCSSDCCKSGHVFCPAECSIDDDAVNLCPYFQDEANK